jgi:ankyrin repeat protein
VRALLDRGADVNRVARHALGVTPLHAALFGRQANAALLLIDRGADVNAARAGKGWPRAGWTALHYAAALGFERLVHPILDRGADPLKQDEEGRTPLQVAVGAHQITIATMLRERGAK